MSRIKNHLSRLYVKVRGEEYELCNLILIFLYIDSSFSIIKLFLSIRGEHIGMKYFMYLNICKSIAPISHIRILSERDWMK